jgi:F-type H+-transporting ATPase subunit b
MDQALLQALEGLFIGAIPTVVLFLLLLTVYRGLVHNPLRRVLAERYDRTDGALAKAKADIAAAAAKTAEYEQKLRDAKVAIFKAQEARRQQLGAMRDASLAEARTRAQALVQQAKAALETDVVDARTHLQLESEALASQLISSVLKPMAAPPTGGPL